MTTSIENLIEPTSPDDIDSPDFKNIIEDHLTWLINLPSNEVKTVTAHQIEVYDFDWIGLLLALGIDANRHYATIRMNGGNSLTDVPKDLRSLRVPQLNVIQNLKMLNSNTKKI